jgi:hypothetical protein
MRLLGDEGWPQGLELAHDHVFEIIHGRCVPPEKVKGISMQRGGSGRGTAKPCRAGIN